LRKHKTARELYAARLIADGTIDEAGAKALVDGYRDKLDAGEVTTELVDADPDDYDLTIDWGSYLKGTLADEADTTVDPDRLRELAVAIDTVPERVVLHARV